MHIASSDSGGCIYSDDTNVDIQNSSFINGISGTSGGSIYLQCEQSSGCNYLISNNTFINSTAQLKGGAVFYDFNRPLKIQENTFISNLAKYGKDIASYPYQMKILNKNTDFLKNLTSEEIISEKLLIGLVDYDEQIVDDGILKTIMFSSNNEGLSVSGITTLSSENGIFEISQLKIIGVPSQSYKLRISTNSIDQKKIDFKQNGLSADFFVDIKLRECIQGELMLDQQCYECPRGSYSLSIKDKSCKKCPSNLKCEGGVQIIVDPNYWRNNTNSTVVYKCPKNQVCLGGFESECQVGYVGRLCTKCNQTSQDNYYARNGLYNCSKCLSISYQVTIIIGLIAGLTLYIMYLLFSLIKNSKRNNPQTLLMRILTNYFQVAMMVKEFQLNWPNQVLQMLEYFSMGGEGYSQVLSFECLIKDSSVDIGINQIYFFVILLGLLPVILSTIAFLIWTLIYQIKRFNLTKKQFKRYIRTSIILFAYLCYPTISQNSFSLLSCVPFEDGNSYLRQDMSIQCWTIEHKKMALSIALPYIIIWAIFFPTLIGFQLYKNRHRLSRAQMMTEYGLFYTGLRDENYYWEVTYVNFKKLIFISFSSILSSVSSSTKISLLFGGMLFLSNDLSGQEQEMTLIFVAIVLLNVIFLMKWAFTFLRIILTNYMKQLQGKIKILQKWNIQTYQEKWTLKEQEIQMVKQQQLEMRRRSSLKDALESLKLSQSILSDMTKRQNDKDTSEPFAWQKTTRAKKMQRNLLQERRQSNDMEIEDSKRMPFEKKQSFVNVKTKLPEKIRNKVNRHCSTNNNLIDDSNFSRVTQFTRVTNTTYIPNQTDQ
ncbi:UNKNOWN [Stylonychia lemnae]|uniref:Transmembrane protein n=1 Tax=Stylonychia lemnae TaxID=5949 RepID=A0A078A6X2_STYLE|nr:UNKNOWN [Stylonychia lemnae]|eukprot:CDW76474.1 UNKNOWN [Stylonychia lemnae]